MIIRCAEVITAWLARHEVVSKDDKELYEYAVYSLLLSIMPVFLIMIMGLLMGKTKESILLILPFMAIRKYSGGFHAKHDWTCLLGSCGLLFLSIYTAAHIPYSLELCVLTFIAVISLCIFSPIDSENRRLTHAEKEKYKKIACSIAIAFFVLFWIFILLNVFNYAVCIAIGLILSSVLQLPCIILMIWDRIAIPKKQ